jgi:hypothetical protein
MASYGDGLPPEKQSGSASCSVVTRSGCERTVHVRTGWLDAADDLVSIVFLEACVT